MQNSPPDLKGESYFSVAYDLITTGVPMPYDLFINSSAIESREKFVRIYPRGDVLSEQDLAIFRTKYRQIYVAESQRTLYLKSICSTSGRKVEEKAAVLKDTAIHYLENLFDHKKELTNEALGKMVVGCRDVVENMVDVIASNDIDTLRDLIANLSFHDFYTYDHSINVSMYNILIFRFLKPNAHKREIVHAGLGGLLHDLGKIRIPTNIINKTTKLTDEEWQEIQRHPDYGCTYLCNPGMQLPIGIDARLVARVVHEHHENFDGTGYPRKIHSEEIHQLARITAISDFFDAVTTKRSYHEPLSVTDALALMERSSGKKLDPALFQLFVQHTQHFEKSKHANEELPRDFDPCQPQLRLPLSLAEPNKKDQDYGKIKIVGSTKDLSDLASENIKIIDLGRGNPFKKGEASGTKKKTGSDK